MEVTQFPGLNDQVYDAQEIFRILLNALSYPGTYQEICIPLTPPPGLTLACAAACLTLLDLETSVWLSSGFKADEKTELESWLRFHTGCHFTSNPERADFAIIQTNDHPEPLSRFRLGTAESPEKSTTLFIQRIAKEQKKLICINGPGISEEREIKLPLSLKFVQEWRENHASYPLGIDVFVFVENTAIGLPRTTYFNS
ncbi:MAG: phosphonate C-P lyase system protein PhnH [Cyanobacteria bacterium J06592_8]